MNEKEEINLTTEREKKSLTKVIGDSIKELKDTTKAFINAPAALWGVNLPYILEGLVYFGILTILGKFSSENVNLTDIEAGFVYSFLTGGITFAMLLLGGVSDKIGVRKSLALSLTIMLAGRILISLAGSLSLANGLWAPMFLMMISGLVVRVFAYG